MLIEELETILGSPDTNERFYFDDPPYSKQYFIRDRLNNDVIVAEFRIGTLLVADYRKVADFMNELRSRR